MSILIKGMEMPQCCGDCHIGFCKQIGCDLYIGFDDYATSRHPDCPISNIPTPHGRLIDADALLRDFPIRVDHYDKEHGSEHFVYGVETVMDYVGGMPTIIEAEE